MNKDVITKEVLINYVSDKCKFDYVLMKELLNIIDDATDEDGVISKKKLVKLIKRFNTKNMIKDFYNTMENTIFDTLSSVNEDKDVCIKLFEGISLNGTYSPEQIKKNNLTGETNLVHSKIKPKFNITRSYCEKLNNK